ncbi:hypothetical protein [Streptomyces brasiliscabiei]|uniref:hypothetical protein n=1 Tax=Streptomyces brasiliscabiei TaxID=2736302 RepID=UPI001C20D310|nr:hypothetical protein [Streptomyces brasiliscabiei]
MADEQYRWLNRDAAERLLRGEPLEAVDADIRARADRLAQALDLLAAEAAPVSPQTPELPGEAAALAAFREASTARADAVSPAARSGLAAHAAEPGPVTEPGRGGPSHTTAAPAADAGLVRLGRPVRARAVPGGRRARWGRPVRYGLVAAVAAGMLGGVTAVAGGGALSAFRDEEPEPSASSSAAGSPDRPLMSPTPNTGQGDRGRGAWGGGTSEAPPDGSAKGDSPSGEGTGGTDEDERSGDSRKGRGSTQERWNGVLSACRDVRDGKELDADRRRALEEAAGGKDKNRLKRFCEGALAGGSGVPGNAKRPGDGAGYGKGAGASGSGDSNGHAGGGDKNTRSGKDSDEDDDSDRGGRGRNGDGKKRHGNGNGHGNGKSHGNGSWNGNGSGSGKHKGGKNKSGWNKNGRGNGGNGHRGQLAAPAPIDVIARVTPA